jgi:hypothetical protein
MNKNKADGVAQVIQHLPSKNKALSSNPSITKKEKKRNALTSYFFEIFFHIFKEVLKTYSNVEKFYNEHLCMHHLNVVFTEFALSCVCHLTSPIHLLIHFIFMPFKVNYKNWGHGLSGRAPA